jgi:hypothetical protein
MLNRVGGELPITAIFPVVGILFAIKFAPFHPVLLVTGVVAILASARIILGKPSDSAFRHFCLAISLFVLVAQWKAYPLLVAAAIMGWVFRGIA